MLEPPVLAVAMNDDNVWYPGFVASPGPVKASRIESLGDYDQIRAEAPQSGMASLVELGSLIPNTARQPGRARSMHLHTNALLHQTENLTWQLRSIANRRVDLVT